MDACWNFTPGNTDSPDQGGALRRFVLSAHIKYRREGLGCAVLDTESRGLRFFNRSAASVLEGFTGVPAARAVAERVAAALAADGHGVASFVDGLVASGLLTVAEPGTITGAEVYFTDVTEFPPDHLFTPIGVECEVTLRCFRRCAYCAYDSSPDVATAAELSTAAWAGVLEHLRDEGVFFVRFTGGDPLTKDDFLGLVEHADRLRLVTTIGSDLTALSEAQARALGRLRHLHAVQTTLDGASPATADRLRGPGNFARVVAGLERLRRHGVPTIVGTVLTRANVGEIEEIGRLAGRLGARYCVAPLYPAGRGSAWAALIPTNVELGQAATAFGRLVASGAVAAADPAWRRLTDGYSAEELTHVWDDQPHLVRRPDRVLRIDARGRCYTSVKLKEPLADARFLGSIVERPLRSIWHTAPLLQRLRRVTPEASPLGAVLDVRKLTSSLPREVHHG